MSNNDNWEEVSKVIPENLNHSIKLDTEEFSFSVSDKLHPLVKTYIFNLGGNNCLLHVYPGEKVVLTASGNGTSEILSNAKLTKTGENSVDADI